ncbi:MAG: hypothetical protein HYZ31_12790 [Gammaproteobacteria bacterium]|nr:hypothetical protein [Gammaproteobacteria bacterium]
MSRTLSFRLKASGLHLAGSGLVIGVFLWLVYGFWYMVPYQLVFSTFDVVKVLIGVDLVLGPLLTFIVFNIAKPRKELARDLAIILAFQLSALAWGVHVTYSVRPQFLAFVGDNLYAVSGRDINLEELPDDIKRRVWYEPPVPVSVRGPQSEDEWKQHTVDLFNSKVPELMYQSRRYRPYAERGMYSGVLPLTVDALREKGPGVNQWLDSVLVKEDASSLAFYKIMAGTFVSWAAVRVDDGFVINVMPVQSVPPPENKS